MLGEDLLTFGIGLAHHGLDLGVDGAGDLFGVGRGLFVVAADKDFAAGRIGDGAECVAHAIFGDHVADDLTGALQVVGGAGGDIAHAQLFGHAAAEEADDCLEHLVAGIVLLVILREADGHAAGRAARDDRDEVDRILRGQDVHRDGVARFVDGGKTLFVLGDEAAMLFRAGNDLDERIFQVFHGDDMAALAR